MAVTFFGRFLSRFGFGATRGATWKGLTLSSAEGWGNYWLRGNNLSYLSIPAVWCAVQQICVGAASLPLHAFERKGGKSVRLHTGEHYAANIWANPSQELTEIETREAIVFSAIVNGKGYAQIVRGPSDEPIELIPLNFEKVKLRQGDEKKPFTLQVYEYLEDTTAPVRHIAARNMFVLSAFNGLGLSAICKTSQELTKAAEEFALQMFKRGVRPGGVLTHPGRMGKDAKERLRRDWDSHHAGLENSFNTVILEEGVTWQQISRTAQDAQAVEVRDFQAKEVARIFNIPLSKLKVSDQAGKPEDENTYFISECLGPWLVRFEQQADKVLVARPDRDWVFFRHNIDARLRGDILTRYKAYAIGRNWGIRNADECRELEGLEPVPGGAGQSFMMPVNMQPLTPDAGSPGARAPASNSAAALLEDNPNDPTPMGGDPAPAPAPAKPATTNAAPAPEAAVTLNGAQVTSLVDIVSQVGAGALPVESAKAIANAAFPGLTADQIEAIFGPIVAKPPAPEPAPTAPADQGNAEGGTNGEPG